MTGGSVSHLAKVTHHSNRARERGKTNMRMTRTSLVIAAMTVLMLFSQASASGPKALGRHAAAATVHWYVVICSSAAATVTLQAGPNSGNNVVFAQWHQGDEQKGFALPDPDQGLGSVFVQLTLPPGNHQTEACVGHDGFAKKAYHMNNGNENHQISWNDNDDGCACQ
jgi:hypothetical protein